MSDLKERLKSHADWLESCGQSQTQAHIDPDNATEAAKDIREAIKAIPEDDGSDCDLHRQRFSGGEIEFPPEHIPGLGHLWHGDLMHWKGHNFVWLGEWCHYE